MPPQPLSSVRSSATIYWGSEAALEKRPTLAPLIARAIAAWAHAESLMSQVLVRMLGAKAEPAAKMYAVLSSTQAQFDVLDAAARCSLQPRDLQMFEAIMWLARRAGKARNKLAHHLWCHSEELPDALLLMDPDANLEFDVQRNEFQYYRDRPLTARLLGKAAPSFPIERIFVYRAQDLLEITTQILRVQGYWAMLSTVVAGPSPGAESNYRELALEPEIQKALARLRGNPKIPPSAPKPPPQETDAR